MPQYIAVTICNFNKVHAYGPFDSQTEAEQAAALLSGKPFSGDPMFDVIPIKQMPQLP